MEWGFGTVFVTHRISAISTQVTKEIFLFENPLPKGSLHLCPLLYQKKILLIRIHMCKVERVLSNVCQSFGSCSMFILRYASGHVYKNYTNRAEQSFPL